MTGRPSADQCENTGPFASSSPVGGRIGRRRREGRVETSDGPHGETDGRCGGRTTSGFSLTGRGQEESGRGSNLLRVRLIWSLACSSRM